MVKHADHFSANLNNTCRPDENFEEKRKRYSTDHRCLNFV